MTKKRYSDPFWRQCYTAALTGITIAAAHQRPAVPDTTALATRDDDDEPADDEPDDDEPGEVVAADFGYRMALVREAISIANMSLDVIKGPLGEDHAFRAGQHPIIERPPIGEIGRVQPSKTV